MLEGRCSDDTIEVVYLSEIAAIRSGFPDLGVYGLLLGLIQEESNLVGVRLRHHFSDHALMEKVACCFTNDPRDPLEVFFTRYQQRKRAVRDTIKVRGSMGHKGTFAEHIYLSILKSPGSSETVDILNSLGVDAWSLRSEIIEQMAQMPKFSERLPPPKRCTYFRSSYFGIFIGVCFDLKRPAAVTAQNCIEKGNIEASREAYETLIKELQTAEERARLLELKLGC